MEFDKNKILTSVTADQAKVGQKGWIGLTLSDLKYCFGKEDKKITLLSIRGENVTTRFVSDKYGAELLFYPAPEPTYAERQAEWVKENNVKIGTKVRITRAFETENVGKKKIVGEIGRVTGIYYDCIIVEVHVENWRCPFTVLEVIKEPSYRPFNNDELNDLVGEVLTNKQSGRRKLVTGKPTASEGVNLDGSYINAKDLLASFYCNENEPCGVKEEL
jgi:hypothetical protein